MQAVEGDILVAASRVSPAERNARRADLVLEGGGVKGIGLVGAIGALEAGGWRLGEPARIAGTSAGAIVGSFLAAGISARRMEKDFDELEHEDILDASPFGALGRGVSLLTRLGLYRGDRLHRWISDRLKAQGVRTFGDLRLRDPVSDLPRDRAYGLVVIVSDVGSGHMVRLPWDFARYGLDADEQPVADAVRASASIPGVFRPVRMRLPGGARATCVDGGLLSNYPITVFDRRDTLRPRWPTFGIKLSARPAPGRWTVGRPARGPVSYGRALVQTMIEAHDRLDLDEPSIAARTVFVDSAGVGATDFRLSREARADLHERGYKAAEKFLTDWDFDAYLTKYRT
ncbi:patatin-like phospholipase family protein [Spirillospora sp. NPDC048911]|uniref:patatin-like phospholipase family protein n=1 Tax=Spirillospora sp. NPDC048911 TaxID=3364527 RepID=UPI00371D4AA4